MGDKEVYPMTDIAVEIILEYVDLYYPVVPVPASSEFFKTRSYQRWSAYEMCHRIMDRPSAHPIDLIEEFQLEMLSYISESDKRTKPFTVAAETAERLILLFV